MSAPRAPHPLPTFLGRPIHGAALALTIAALAVAVGWAISPFRNAWTAAGAGYALCVVVILTVGWLVDRRAWVSAGLLASLVLWVYTGFVVGIYVDSVTSALLAAAWAVLAGYSYACEVRDVDGRRW